LDKPVHAAMSGAAPSVARAVGGGLFLLFLAEAESAPMVPFEVGASAPRVVSREDVGGGLLARGPLAAGGPLATGFLVAGWAAGFLAAGRTAGFLMPGWAAGFLVAGFAADFVMPGWTAGFLVAGFAAGSLVAGRAVAFLVAGFAADAVLALAAAFVFAGGASTGGCGVGSGVGSGDSALGRGVGGNLRTMLFFASKSCRRLVWISVGLE
jgi:hypothetical protein